MRAGLLKYPIEIWTKTITTNDFGEEEETWDMTYQTRARLLHDGGTRVVNNEQIFYEHSKTFQVREYVPVGEYDRIKWRGDFYRILNIEPDVDRMQQIIKTELVDD